jgi:TolB-like protein/Tfp pilus assembly protein PilF
MTKAEPGIFIHETDGLQIADEEVRHALEQVLGSRTFRVAQGQQAFLKYTVQEVLAGRGQQIKEYLIGTEALGRGESFDPRLDPIVRTQARKLRTRLALYYETQGSGDVLRIEFRKGSYAPSFRRAEIPTVSTETVTETPRGPSGDPAIDLSQTAIQPHQAAQLNQESPAGRRSLDRRSLLIFLALTCVVSAMYFAFRQFGSRQAGGVNASIAVVPFANLENGAEGGEFWSDGLPQEVIDLLEETPGLQVVARTSTFHFRSRSPNVAEISRKLKVQTVLTGTIRKAKDRLVVTVELNDRNGSHLWSGSYDRPRGTSGTIPREIARSVVNVLGVASPVKGAEASNPANELAPSLGAHENYLKGLYFFNKLNAQSLRTAIAYLQEAIAEDPSYARAYAALADCYVIAPQVATIPPLQVVSKIKAAAVMALALNEHLGEPHIDLAVAAEYEYDWKTAEQEFKRGLQLSPGNVVGHLWYAKYLGIVDRRPELLAQRRLAVQLDPISPYAIQAVAGYLSVSGQYDQAIEQFQAALALDPNFGLAHQGLGVAYLLKGMKPQAVAELRLARELMTGPRRDALLGFAYAVNGDTANAKRILKDFQAHYDNGQIPALSIATIYIGLGDRDRAFEWLNKAIDQRDLNLDLQWDSFYVPLRDDPRYKQLLRRMKLL